MIASKALPNGGIRIELDDKSEEMPAQVAISFISRMLEQMRQQAEQSRDDKPEGAAIIQPHAVGVEMDRETGEPRLRLSFGKAMLILSMPPGAMRAVANTIIQSGGEKLA